MCEALLLHIEHGMALPMDLQGKPVEFYLQMREKINQSRKKSREANAPKTPKSSLGTIAELYKDDVLRTNEKSEPVKSS